MEQITAQARASTLTDLAPPAGAPVPELDERTMLEVDRIATDEVQLGLLQMMENAGRELATLVRRACGGDASGRRCVVLAGSGNNAGGGMAAARRLSSWGTATSIVFARPVMRLRPGPCAQLEPLGAAGVPLAVAGYDVSLDEVTRQLDGADVVIDALIGYSLSGVPDEAYTALIGCANASRTPVVSLDVPSGIDATTGDARGAAIHADATVAVALPKVGTSRGAGRRHAGMRYLADIGIPPSVYERVGVSIGPIFAQDSLVKV